MQGKGLIKVFVAALIVVCFYQLLFTFSSYQIEKEATQFAQNEVLGGSESMLVPEGLSPSEQAVYIDSVNKEFRNSKNRFLDSLANEPALNLGFAKFSYSEVKEKQISLGLDLQGGMSVVLQISLEDLVKAMANNSKDPTFLKAIENAKQRQSNTQENFVVLFGQEFQKLDPGAKLAAIFATAENKDKINFNSTNEQVLAVIRKEADGAIERTFNIIRSRIDEFGVTQPSISLQATTGRIIVELPGVDNAERARRLLQATAQLEFWETYNNREVFDFMVKANDVLAVMKGLNTEKKDTASNDVDVSNTVADLKADEESPIVDEEVKDDLAGLLGEDGVKDSDTEGLMDDEDIQKKFPLFSNGSILMPAIGQDENGQSVIADGPVVGYAFTQNRAKVSEYLAIEKVRAVFPKNIKFIWGAHPVGDSKNLYALYAIKTRPTDERAPLEGDAVSDAYKDFDQNGRPCITMFMNSEGQKVWRRITKENIGRAVAIVLDNTVYSAPVVQGEINQPKSQITGSFSVKEAQDLANIIKAGKLPAPAQIVEEEIVGPTLGKESIQAGLMSLLIGIGLVILFMAFYYTGAGLLADAVLLLNMFMIMGVLAGFQASLTLPGMAGLVLTIGMAVDANVIIFERIREEILKGKSLRLSISDGFSNSYSAIIDSNVTSLITGFILMAIGIGPVKGFATVFVIGVFSSFVTAVLVSRLIFEWYVNSKDRTISFGSNLTLKAFSNINMKFIEKRKMAYVISGVVMLLGIGSMLVRGFDFGIDFKGGRTYVVRFDQNVSTEEISASLTQAIGETPLVRTFGGANQVKITSAYLIDDENIETDSIVDALVYSGVKKFFTYDVDFSDYQSNYRLSSQKVGPTVADDIKTSSILASILSLLGIFIYLAIRFRRWEFGVGAIASTVHDVLFILSLFSVFKGLLPFSTEIDQAIIAAILTVIGYSVNDTVIVFDRIREFINLHPTRSLTDNVNGAINTTLSRTLMTSFTTLLVVVILFLFGGEVIRGFSFALLIGIGVGTYSSIFIASPIVVDLLGRRKGVKK